MALTNLVVEEGVVGGGVGEQHLQQLERGHQHGPVGGLSYETQNGRKAGRHESRILRLPETLEPLLLREPAKEPNRDENTTHDTHDTHDTRRTV